MKADAFLRNQLNTLQDRAKDRDAPEGERSMASAVAAFNAMYDTNLTETQGWQFMVLLKMSRAKGGKYRADDYADQVGYSALAGECAGKQDEPSSFNVDSSFSVNKS